MERMTMAAGDGGFAVYGGGALGRVILAQLVPGGADPWYVAPLIVDAAILVIAPLVFIVGWAMVRAHPGPGPTPPAPAE